MRLTHDMARFSDPAAWVEAVKSQGYSAANVPVGPETGDAGLAAFVKAAAANDIVFGEVGAWGTIRFTRRRKKRGSRLKTAGGTSISRSGPGRGAASTFPARAILFPGPGRTAIIFPAIPSSYGV